MLDRRRRKTGAAGKLDRPASHDIHLWNEADNAAFLREQRAEGIIDGRWKLALLQRGIKRAIDIIVALSLLVLLLPLLLAIAIAIRIDSPGFPLFAHRRLGRAGRHFDCFKFRSMRRDAEHVLHSDEALRHQYVTNHFKIPTEVDPRVTPLGRFLRRSSLDELPQLWNVVIGDMSLVGPRPIVALEGTYYGERLPELLSVRPGITGIWAVGGRSKVGYPDRVNLELGYLEKRSLLLDLSILARTPWTVFTRHGAV